MRQVRRVGERIDLPDDAESVTVEPLPRAGLVRVTYLSPVQRLAIDGAASDGSREDDADDAPDYIN